MKKKFSISMVSFLNTLPFRYALNHSEEIRSLIELSEDIPSLCAKKILNKEADIGLIPVAVLPELGNYHIISDYCIGAKQVVDSVFLFSHKPMHELTKVYLDFRSRTSVKLVQVLSENYWNIAPEFVDAKEGYESEIFGTTGGVVIGDKALSLLNAFPYQYDLASAWYEYTGEEFVFAAWVSREKLPQDFLKAFNEALSFGLEQMDAAISIYSENYENLPVEHYLRNRIDYHWNESKRRSLKRFLKEI